MVENLLLESLCNPNFVATAEEEIPVLKLELYPNHDD
jgi:hypothetical protein